METGEKYRILVVDDNDDVRRLVKKVLVMSGHAVMEAAFGQEALTIAEAEIPDLILMDIRLPGELNGLETTRRIKEDPALARVPVVALTASVLEQDRMQALAAGCSGFIGKPIDINDLPGMVDTFISRGVSKPR
ncbi:MAG: response regulator [Thermoleophilia bacterium]